MRILGMTPPEILVMLATRLIPILILYWTIRFAVKHGVRDAMGERSEENA